MTDAELAKSVADACGIKVGWDYIEEEWKSSTTLGAFDPARNWHDAMFAAEKCGLFDQYFTELSKNASGWQVEVLSVGRWTNDSGPRAICEAILAVQETA